MFKKLAQYSAIIGIGSLPLFSSGQSVSAGSDEHPKRWFDVEVIVFKNLRGNLDEELWPQKQSIEFPESIKDIITETLYPISENLKRPESEQDEETDNNENSAVTEQQSAIDSEDRVALTPFSLLDESEYQLTSVVSSLGRSSQYRPLAHFSWRQPVEGKAEAPWVRIVGGKNYYDEFEYSGDSKNAAQNLNRFSSSSSWTKPGFDNLTTDNEILDEEGLESDDAIASISYQPVPEIDGAIRIYLERYLHINTQLYLRIPGQEEVDISDLNANLSSSLLNMTDDGVLDSNYESSFGWTFDANNWFDQNQQFTLVDRLLNYPLVQSRRVRSEETHYFDHPLFGVIVQIRPYEPEENNDPQSGEY